MKALDPTVSPLTITNFFSPYLLARLRANPLLTAQANTVQAADDVLSSALQAYWTAQKTTMTAVSVRDSKEYLLDASLRALRNGLLVGALNDRRSEIFRSVLPDGLSPVLYSNPEDKVAQVRRVLQNLAEFVSPALPAETQGVQAALDALVASMAEVDAADSAEQTAWGAVCTARLSYCHKYSEVYHQLILTLGEKRQAEAYFRPSRRARPAAPAPVPEPVAGPLPTLQTVTAAQPTAVSTARAA